MENKKNEYFFHRSLYNFFKRKKENKRKEKKKKKIGRNKINIVNFLYGIQRD